MIIFIILIYKIVKLLLSYFNHYSKNILYNKVNIDISKTNMRPLALNRIHLTLKHRTKEPTPSHQHQLPSHLHHLPRIHLQPHPIPKFIIPIVTELIAYPTQ